MFKDSCGELIGMGENRLVQRPLSLTVCWEWFAYLQTLTFAVILPCAVFYGVCHCLIVGSEHIGRSHATSSDKTYFILSNVCPSPSLMCLDFHGYPTNENRGKNVKNQQQQKSNTADDRQLAATKRDQLASSFSTSFASALWVKEQIFSI